MTTTSTSNPQAAAAQAQQTTGDRKKRRAKASTTPAGAADAAAVVVDAAAPVDPAVPAAAVAADAPPTTPVPDADPAPPAPTTASGVCIEVISKRLKALRKRLTKIERTESQNPKELNKDQLESIQRKPELLILAKELEEILKSLSVCEAEEVKENEKKSAEIAAKQRTAVSTAVDAAKADAARATQSSLRLLYTLNVVLPNISTMRVNLTDSQFAALHKLSSILFGAADSNTAESIDAHLSTSLAILDLYTSSSSAVFHDGVTYAQLNSLVASILSPPPPPKFGVIADDIPAPVAPISPVPMPPSQLQQQQQIKTVMPANSMVGGSPPVLRSVAGINFINPSEVDASIFSHSTPNAYFGNGNGVGFTPASGY